METTGVLKEMHPTSIIDFQIKMALETGKMK